MQLIKNKKAPTLFTVLMIILALGIGTLAILNIFGEHGAKPSSQADYPVLPEPQVMASFILFDLKQMTDYSDLVIQGTVSSILPAKTETFLPTDNTVDGEMLRKAGSKGYTITKYPAAITVDTVLKGEVIDKEIILNQFDMTIDAVPVLKEGTKMLFFLNKINDGYKQTTMDGYYYVAADDKVYPARLTDELKNTSGMDLNRFIEEVKGYAAQTTDAAK